MTDGLYQVSPGGKPFSCTTVDYFEKELDCTGHYVRLYVLYRTTYIALAVII